MVRIIYSHEGCVYRVHDGDLYLLISDTRPSAAIVYTAASSCCSLPSEVVLFSSTSQGFWQNTNGAQLIALLQDISMMHHLQRW